MTTVDDEQQTDNLPATQYLLLETLSARLRLGEPFWTFPMRFHRAALALADQTGMVSVETIGQGLFRLWPTAKLERELTRPDDKYLPPAGPVLTNKMARVVVVAVDLMLADPEFMIDAFDYRERALLRRAVTRLRDTHLRGDTPDV